MNKITFKQLLIYLFLLLFGAAGHYFLANFNSKHYDLDFFSLLNFALSVTALVLSLFMGWLSWQFYLKSDEASSKTSETIAKIETIVISINSSISGIVDKAISHWSKGGQLFAQQESELEIKNMLSEIKQTVNEAPHEDQSELKSKLEELTTEIDEKFREFRETQLRSAFANNEIAQQKLYSTYVINSADEKSQEGVIKIVVTGNTDIATAPIKFRPRFSVEPKVELKLLNCPYDDVEKFTHKAGTPTRFHCNIHLNSYGPLKLGEYVFEFKAST